MSETVSTKDPLRHRLYFWLMDAALVGSVIIWIAFILDAAAGITAFGLPEPLASILGIILIPLVTVVPVVVFFGAFMRDEYAEQLWRRTMVVLAYVAAIIPFGYFLTAWATFFAMGQPEEPHWAFAWSVVEVKWGLAIWYLWNGYIQLFVFIFQFLRWRDSR